MTDFQKIWFRLHQDEDGYPPAQAETVSAVSFSEETYVLENVPFFARGVSLGDLISTSEDSEGRKWFQSVLKPSGHSTVRVIVFRNSGDPLPLEERVAALRRRFAELGCTTELSHVSGLFAVDVPPAVDYSKVHNLLEEGNAKYWDYEEASIRHPT